MKLSEFMIGDKVSIDTLDVGDWYLPRLLRAYIRTVGGTLQAARGQARIPSMIKLEQLVAKAKQLGWGSNDSDAIMHHE